MATTHTLRKSMESRRALRQRKNMPALGIILALGSAGALALSFIGCGGGISAVVSPPPIPAVQPLQIADVQNIVQAPVNSVNFDMEGGVVGVRGFGCVGGAKRNVRRHL